MKATVTLHKECTSIHGLMALLDLSSARRPGLDLGCDGISAMKGGQRITL